MIPEALATIGTGISLFAVKKLLEIEHRLTVLEERINLIYDGIVKLNGGTKRR